MMMTVQARAICRLDWEEYLSVRPKVAFLFRYLCPTSERWILASMNRSCPVLIAHFRPAFLISGEQITQ